MNYLSLKEHIFSISKKMFSQICVDMDKFENKQYNYFFALVNEVYKGLELCCHAIDIQAYAQIGTLLRQLFEQVATAKIISVSEENLTAYVQFAKAKKSCVENGNDMSILKRLYSDSKLSKSQKGSQQNYYTLGWLELIGVNTITYEKLLELAEIPDLASWRSFCNNFVHTNITYMQFTPEGMIKTNIEFIYILAALFDVTSCSYHNLTHFNFVFDSVDLFSEFSKDYAEITEYRKQHPDNH